MRKLIHIILVYTAMYSAGYAQSLELISGGGSYAENSNGSLSWSIGEPVIMTVEGSANHITQGFHQSDIRVSGIEDIAGTDISVYPNPTSGLVNIVVNNTVYLQVYDAQGRLMKEAQLTGSFNELDLSDVNRGVYILHFRSEGNIINTIRIIKQ